MKARSMYPPSSASLHHVFTMREIQGCSVIMMMDSSRASVLLKAEINSELSGDAPLRVSEELWEAT
jgi:hypothetical protein